MEPRLDDLEKAVSKAVRAIKKLQKDRQDAGSGVAAATEKRSRKTPPALVEKLTAENVRLKEERKEARKRIRSIIRDLDRMK